MLEKKIESKLVKEVKLLGGKAYKWPSGHKGMPDRLVVLPPGVIWFVETKRPKGGVLSPLQAHRLKQLQELGCRTAVLATYGDVEEWVRTVCKNT